jgi:hypothetical protein
MANIWRLKINVVNAQDAEKMKDCVRELSKEYTLVPTSDNPDDGWYQAGLEYGDDFVCYTDGIVERLEQFNELAEKVAAQFPEMPLLFTQFNTDNQGLYRYESKDGEFVRISPLKVTLHTNDAEDFNQLWACAEPLLTAQGINADVDTATQEITWGYSEENEAQVCDALIAKMSEQMPDIQVVCMKHDVDNHEFGGLQYCIMGKGEGEWKKITGATFDIAYAIWYASLDSALWLTVYDAFTDPEKCIKALLEVIRKSDSQGDNILNYSVQDIMFREEKFLHLLQPEDKQWLLDLDNIEADCIVLGGMYKRRQHFYDELFTDEETGEQVTIQRYDTLDTPLWSGTAEEAQALYDKICASSRRQSPIVHHWISYTPFNPMVIVEKTMADLENMPHNVLMVHPAYGWACEELGYAYYYGEEQWGYHKDLDKARKYYELAEQVKANTQDEDLLRAGNPFNA